MAPLEEGNHSYMIEVGMEDQEFGDLLLIDSEFIELSEEIRHEVHHASADDHVSIASFKQIDS